MHVSTESPAETVARLRRVIAAAELTVCPGTYGFAEVSLSEPPLLLGAGAVACVRADHVWSFLRPSSAPTEELWRLLWFHFAAGVDNSGCVGWLGSRLKARVGTGVFVICGQNRALGGVFDY